MITLRPANATDIETLFAWRNDPVTTANSRSPAPVSREDHWSWMKYNVFMGYPQHIVMIAEDPDHGAIGVVRFDADEDDLMIYEASLTIAPKYRGRGLARSVLEQACRHMSDYTIEAEIRSENAPSRRAFESCDFAEIGESGGFVKYRRESL